MSVMPEITLEEPK